MANGLVLVADDDPVVVEAIRRKLEETGYDAVVVNDGVAAIAELHGAEFDVAFVELRVPGRGAFDVLSAAHHLSPDTEVVVMTRDPELPVALECIRRGAFDFLGKPLDLDELAMTLARAIERKKLRTTTTLYRASQEIFASHDAEKLPKTVVDIAARVMEADDVSLALMAPDGRMQTVHSRSISPEMRAVASMEVGDDLAMRVAELGEAILLPEDTLRGLRGVQLERVRSSIVFPMSSGERRVGVLTLSRVGDPRPYRRSDLERTGVLAAQVLLAVENATLVRQMIVAERLASIGQLAAGVAHEINNPLTYVLSSGVDAAEQVAALLDMNETEGVEAARARRALLLQVEDALKDVADGGRRIADIARDLRTLARGNAPSRELVSLGAIVRAALRITASSLRDNASTQIELSEDAIITGHAGRMTQVFVNLLVNASQSVPRDARVHIVIRAERVGDRVVASVRDDGAGIPPEHIGSLFQPFFSTKSSAQGTGLGLSLTQSIVAEHQGTITVESEIGKGACFVLSFPAAASADGLDDLPPSRPSRLVFIDRDVSALRAYERWFGRHHDVLAFTTGADALDLLARRVEIDAVIVDLDMQDIGASEIYRRACAEEPTLAGRFVFVSSAADGPEAQAFSAATGRPVLAKPVDLPALQMALRLCAEAA